MFHRYNQLLIKRPLLTNVVTTGFLFGTGDVLAQSLLGDKYNLARTGRSVAFGALFFAPIGDKWYKLLAQFGSKSPASHIARVAADQLVFAPFVAIPMYFSVMTMLEGQSVDEISPKLKHNWSKTVVDNWKVWPAFQFVNFWFVPVGYRLMCGNMFAIGWNGYLSMRQHEK